MKILIRISGMVDIKSDIASTLDRLRLRRKYACVIVDEKNPVIAGMIKKVRNFIAYGDINKETLIELIKARGKALEKNKKIDAEVIAEKILKQGNLEDLEIKPFFRLHPPRKGINSKQHFPKGVLGDHKEKINDLIKRML